MADNTGMMPDMSAHKKAPDHHHMGNMNAKPPATPKRDAYTPNAKRYGKGMR